LLGHSNLTIAVTAAEALVNIDARKGIEELMPLIAHRSAWPRTRIGQILNAAGPEAVTRPYCSAIHDASVSEAIQLLRYFEAALVSDVDSAVAEMLLRRTDPGLISAALKAVRGHLPTTLIKRFVRHHTWYVRMQTANLLGRLGRREDYPRLEPLLSDSEWWVRYRAAQALVNLPYLDLSSLLDLQRRQQDPYARDILGQAIAEAGLA
jgi:HEAT repeat protein